MRKQKWLVALGVLFVASLIACSGGGGGGTTGGSSYILQVSGNPADARVYLNDNSNSVNNPSRIELPPGTHRIRVEIPLENGQAIFQTFSVEAGQQTHLTYDLYRYRIEAEPNKVEVWAGLSVTVSARMHENNQPVQANFTWCSQNPAIATVNNTGRITGVARGNTWVIVTDTLTGLGLKIPVTVLDFPPPPEG